MQYYTKFYSDRFEDLKQQYIEEDKAKHQASCDAAVIDGTTPPASFRALASVNRAAKEAWKMEDAAFVERVKKERDDSHAVKIEEFEKGPDEAVDAEEFHRYASCDSAPS